MVYNKHLGPFRENIYNIIIQVLESDDLTPGGSTQKQIRQWIDEELQLIDKNNG